MTLPTLTDDRQAAEIERLHAAHMTALASPEIRLPNAYRIGDTVALLTLLTWLERQYGAKTWYIDQPDKYGFRKTVETLRRFCPAIDDLTLVFNGCEPPSPVAPARYQTIPTFQDGCPSLWWWNQFFNHQDYRLQFEVRPSMITAPILFAPLLTVPYRREREMSHLFCLTLAELLAKMYPGRMAMIVDELHPHDLERFRRIPALQMVSAPLPDVIAAIGQSRVFIGGDTGLSHIAGCFDEVRQVALYSRENRELHDAWEQTTNRMHGEVMEMLTGYRAHYDAAPNKHAMNLDVIYFTNHGLDETTLEATLKAVERGLG